MSKDSNPEFLAFNHFLNSIPQDKDFLRVEIGKRFPGFSEGMKSNFITRLINSGYLKQVKRATYKRLRLIPEEMPYSDDSEKRQDTFLDDEKSGHGKRDETEMFLGKRESDELLERLTKKSVIDLVVGGEIKFEIKLVCSRIERNYQDQIISFSVDSIDVSVKNNKH